MERMADRDRFAARTNFEWQVGRPVTYFWPMLEGAFKTEGICGLRREVCAFIKSQCEDCGVYLEFVNCLTHIAGSVLEGRRRALIEKGIERPIAREKASEWPLYRSVVRCWEVAHQMFRLRKSDKRGWHIKLSKLEAEWM